MPAHPLSLSLSSTPSSFFSSPFPLFNSKPPPLLPSPPLPLPPPNPQQQQLSSFGNDGYIDLEITKWEYWHKKGADGIDLQRVAFVAADSRAAAAGAAAAARGECPLDAPGAVRLLDFEQVDYNRREGFNATFFNGRLLELVPKYKGVRGF